MFAGKLTWNFTDVYIIKQFSALELLKVHKALKFNTLNS